MGIRRALALLSVLLAPLAAAAETGFNGEVLVAPPPPNWTGGSPVALENGSLREWRRSFPNGNGRAETLSIRRLDGAGGSDAGDLARQAALDAAATCAQRSLSEVETVTAAIGRAAAITVRCARLEAQPAEVSLFAMVRTYSGEFDAYAVTRVWIGAGGDPSGPGNSEKTAAQWRAFFQRISVCNTLTDDCDPADAAMIHAHPRFRTMRPLPVSAKPVMPRQTVFAAADKLGALTGRAAACGEDTAPLIAKIGRMFGHVTATSGDAEAALERFQRTRAQGERDQSGRPKETCGDVLRTYRQHPTRVGAFPRYVESLL